MPSVKLHGILRSHMTRWGVLRFCNPSGSTRRRKMRKTHQESHVVVAQLGGSGGCVPCTSHPRRMRRSKPPRASCELVPLQKICPTGSPNDPCRTPTRFGRALRFGSTGDPRAITRPNRLAPTTGRRLTVPVDP